MDDTRRRRVARHLFHKSSDALFLFDLGGHRVLDANAAARRLTGFDATSLRGMTLEGLLAAGAPDGPSGPVLVEADRDETGVVPFRAPRRGFRLLRRGGKPIPVRVGTGVIASGAEAGAGPLGLAVVRDDDDRAGEAEILDRFFALGPDLFGAAAHDGLILKVNAAWEHALGYPAGELVGTSFWDLVHPAAFDDCAGARRATGRGGVSGLELRMRRKDGGDRRISWNVAFVEGRLFAVGRDVTERRQLEAGLRRAQEAAAAAHRAKSEFLAGMSHEIRTPMTAILGFAGLLAERWRRPDAVAAAEDLDALQTIQRNGDLLLGLINDILDLAKIEADRTEIAPAPCSPAQLVADVMGLMHVRADAQGLSLGAEFLTPIPAAIATDGIRLRQILINLIGNAIKFTDRGGVRLRVRMAPGDASGRADGAGPTPPVLEFDVVDTGIGIRDEDIARLFQPFYRVDASQTRRHGGAGLGLALSLRLAERLGGTIAARSRAEGGSVFTLTIPVGPAEAAYAAPVPLVDGTAPAPTPASIPSRPTPPPASNPSSPPLASRVLLAEDNRDTQRVMLLRLAAAGIDVTPAHNGQVAVDLALEADSSGRPFDVILMDMQMPVLDGYEATRTLRGAGYRRPILAVTAHAMSEDRDECLRFGCDEYVAKPIDWPRLTALIAAFARQAAPPADGPRVEPSPELSMSPSTDRQPKRNDRPPPPPSAPTGPSSS